MFRICINKSIFGCSALLTHTVIDIPKENGEQESLQHDNNSEITPIRELKPQTGWDRLYKMYTLDEFHNLSQELQSCLNVMYVNTLAGVMYGGITASKDAYHTFLERNQASRFTSMAEARRDMQNYMSLQFARAALHWGRRLALFSIHFALISTSLSVYYNRSSIWDYLYGGMFTGAVYKVNMGVRGMVAGAVVGSALGLFAGCSVLSVLSISGKNMDEVREWQSELVKLREKKQNDLTNASIVEKSKFEADVLLKKHDDAMMRLEGSSLNKTE